MLCVAARAGRRLLVIEWQVGAICAAGMLAAASLTCVESTAVSVGGAQRGNIINRPTASSARTSKTVIAASGNVLLRLSAPADDPDAG